MSNASDDSGRPRGDLSPEEKARLERRLSELGSKLDRVKSERAKATGADDDARGRALGMGFGLAAQLVAGVIVGGAIGYLLDQWLGTRPWMLMLFLIIGFAAGMLNVVRAARSMQKTSEAQSKGAKSVPFDDEDEK
jgi:ATP synthase protein I